MEKPILFNTEMVKAILEGRKTQTRRIIKNKYDNAEITFFENKYGKRLVYRQNDADEPVKLENGRTKHKLVAMEEIKKPCEVGDILWVRETWAKIDDFVNYADLEIDKDLQYLYKCDDKGIEHSFVDVGVKRWRPSIHMPKEVARIFLKVTHVRAERIQEIELEGMQKEGIIPSSVCGGVQKQLQEEYFKPLWDGIYKNWDDNPWVWVIEFEVKEVKQ